MEHLSLWGLCGLLMIWSCFSSGRQALEVYVTLFVHLLSGGYFIRFDLLLGPHGRDFD